MRQILLIVCLSIIIVALSQLVGMTSAKADLLLPPTAKTVQAETALMKAIARENTSEIQKLLKQKNDINAKDSSGNTALLYAVSTGSPKIVKMILAKKPDLKVTYGANQENILFEAARVNSADIAKQLVHADKSLLTQLSAQGENALFEAARGGAKEVVTYLVSQGMNTQIKNAAGKTAGDIAQENGLDSIVKELKKSK